MEAVAPAVIRSPIEMSRPSFLRSSIPIKHYSSISYGKSSKRSFTSVRASSDFCGSLASIAPLKLESPTGQFLSQMLINHPHLVSAAVEQQLQQLQNEETYVSGSDDDLVLRKRIAEAKANERRKVLEEILYALVVQKFMDADVSLVPTIAADQADTLPSQDEKLEKLHSLEVNEMIQSHLALLGNLEIDPTMVAELSKLKVGEVYAQSVMYGYFLKRVDQRFQLEKTMKILPNDMKDSRLRSYVMSFGGETLQRYAKIRSKEAISIIDKHTEALFGGPTDSSKDEVIKLSFGGLKSLVLEAVTFGSFLWEVESSMHIILY